MSVNEINYNKSLPNVELSILTPTRSKNNSSSNLKQQLDSIVEFSSPEELNKLECILKFDHDDEVPSFLNEYPFRIKWVQYARGGGRWEVQNFQTYLCRLREATSRFILVLSDDFVIKRPFINEILSIDKEYTIVGGATRAHGERWPGGAELFKDDNISIPLGGDWRNTGVYGHCIAHYAMICSSKVADSMVDLGFIPCNDLCYLAIAMCIYKEFGVNIWHDMTSFYYRDEFYTYPPKWPDHLEDEGITQYNVLDLIYFKNNNRYADNYWRLIYQAAKNIYLNMKYDNII